MKFIKENFRQKLNEFETVQYENEGKEIKNFISEINYVNIDVINTNKVPDHFEIDDSSKLSAEWSCEFYFRNEGFTIKPQLQNMKGIIVMVYKKEKYNFKIDSSYQIKFKTIGFDDILSGNGLDFDLKHFSITIDLDNKIIIL